MINIYEPSYNKDELKALEKVFKSKWIGKGKITEKFVKTFAGQISSRHKHFETINSCTEALFLTMRLANISAGDEVIIPSIHFIGAANAIKSVGATPVFCDVNDRTLNVEAKHIKPLITHKTKAVIILHFGGRPCDMQDIITLANENSLWLIEDNANSPFSTYMKTATGTLGDFGTWSFDAMKILSVGDGGMLFCKNKHLIDTVKEETYLGLKTQSGFSNTTSDKWWEFDIGRPGRRSIMNDITSALGLTQLKKVPFFIVKRKMIYERYERNLGKLDWLLVPPPIEDDRTSSYYMFHIQTLVQEDRDKLAIYLKEKGIYTTFRYYPLHKVPYYDEGLKLPNAEYIMNHTLCIPLHQNLTENEVNYIMDTIREFKDE